AGGKFSYPHYKSLLKLAKKEGLANANPSESFRISRSPKSPVRDAIQHLFAATIFAECEAGETANFAAFTNFGNQFIQSVLHLLGVVHQVFLFQQDDFLIELAHAAFDNLL